MKTLSKLMILLMIIGFVQTGNTQAQSLKDLRNKAKNVKLKKKKVKTTETKTNTTTTTKTSEVKKEEVVVERSLLEKVTEEQAKIIAENKIRIKTDEVYDPADSDLAAHLTFSTDFSKASDNLSYTGKDCIYAHLKMDKKISDLIAKTYKNKNVSNYSIKYYVKVDDGSASQNHKSIQEEAFFNLIYDATEISFPVIADESFYDRIINKHKKDGEFVGMYDEADAYKDILSRSIFSNAISKFGRLSVGEHKVEIELEIGAMYGSKYVFNKNIKGVFMLTIDKESTQRYSQIYTNLNDAYNKYKVEEADARMYAKERHEKRRVAKMTPEEKELYEKEEYDKFIKDRNAVMDDYAANPSEASDNEYTIYVKNNNSGVSVRIIVKDSRGSEDIYTITHNQTQKLSLWKGQNYIILVYGQSAAKSTARKVATVSEKNDGQTINVK